MAKRALAQIPICPGDELSLFGSQLIKRTDLISITLDLLPQEAAVAWLIELLINALVRPAAAAAAAWCISSGGRRRSSAHSHTRLYLLDLHRADHLFMYSFPPLRRRLLSRA